MNISGPSSVVEGDATTAYTVSLSPSGVIPTSDLTVTYATSDGTATAGSDYTAASGTLAFTGASAGPHTFTVQTTEDSADDYGETFSVTISSPAGGGGPSPVLGTSSVSTTIIAEVSELKPPPTIVPPPVSLPDEPTPGAITLSVSPSSIAEDDGPTAVRVTVTLRGGATQSEDVTVSLALSGTAGESDYTASSLPAITIPAGQSSGSGTLTITPADDGIVESPESIFVTGSAAGFDDAAASISLTDASDDNRKVVKAFLSIESPSAETPEGSTAEFTVTLSHRVAADITVAWSVIPGTADAGDVTAAAGTVTFTANSAAGATQTIEVAVPDDNLSELAETFSVTLGTISGDLASRVLVDPNASSASATIAESDPITVSISGPSTVDEGENTTAYTVSLSPSGVTPAADLTVNYATSNGTATGGSDFTAVSGTLTFTRADAGARTFTVQTTQDSIDEGTGETFSVTISDPVGGGGPSPVLGTSSVSTKIVEENSGITPPPAIVPPPVPPPTIVLPPLQPPTLEPPQEPPPDEPTAIEMTLSVSPSNIAEDDGPTAVTVTVTLKGGATQSEDVNVTLALSGTAGESDYTASSLAAITIPAGRSSGSGTLTITPSDDGIVENPESIIVTGSAAGFDDASAPISLTDASDDDGEVVKAFLSIESPSAETPEGSTAEFTVTLSRQVAADITVAWSVIPRTADAGDITATVGTVTFAANSAAGATQSIEIEVVDDNLSEPAETFTVTLGTVSGDLASRVLVAPNASSAAATISESDPITVSVSGPASVEEGDATTVYTVSLLPAGVTPTADLTVFYSTVDGTAELMLDYMATSGTFTFTRADAGPRNFMVQTTEDNEDEGAGETFSVVITFAPTRADAGAGAFSLQTRGFTQVRGTGDLIPAGGGPSPSLGASSATTTIIDDDASGDNPSDAPPPNSEPPEDVPSPDKTPTPVPGTPPPSAPVPGATPTPPPGTAAAPVPGTTPTPEPGNSSSSTPGTAPLSLTETTPSSMTETTPTPELVETPTALPVPTPTPGTTLTLTSGTSSTPRATPTPSTLPPGSTPTTTADANRTLTLGRTTTTTPTSSTSSTPESGAITTFTTGEDNHDRVGDDIHVQAGDTRAPNHSQRSSHLAELLLLLLLRAPRRRRQSRCRGYRQRRGSCYCSRY